MVPKTSLTPRPAPGARGLPAPINNFVGREHELESLGALIGSARLTTLVGPGGMGKTRLGLEVANRNAGYFPQGAWFVDLAAAAPGSVVAAAFKALSISHQPAGDAVETLIDEIGGQRMLLLLDNCEHVIDEVGALADRLLSSCPGISILATSREPLNLLGEKLWRLGPLPAPAGSPTSIGSLTDNAAVRLFFEIASGIRPEFRLNHSNAAVVAQICRRVEGIPLVVQLAALRLKSATPEEILSKLDQGVDFLIQDSRNAAKRHHSLADLFGWGHDLLTESQRALFRRLSVFEGGFTLEAAEQICAGSAMPGEQVAATLEQLEFKSLLTSDTSKSPTRYLMLETVRRFAESKLDDSQESSEFVNKHRQWFSDLASKAATELTGGLQKEWVTRLEHERANLRKVLKLALETASPLACQLSADLSMFWWLAGYFNEGLDWLERALALPAGSDPGAEQVRAKALWGLALLAGQLGEFDKAMNASKECLTLYRKVKDARGKARASLLRGLLLLFQDTGGALSWSEKGASLANRAKDDWCLAESFANCGRAEMMLGNPVQSNSAFSQALSAAKRANDSRAMAAALIGLGWVSMPSDLSGAETILLEAAEKAAGSGRHEQAECLLHLAEAKRNQKNNKGARELLENALVMAQEMGSRVLTARAYAGLARLSQSDGDQKGAAVYFDHVIELAKNAGFAYILVRALQGRSQLAWTAGDRVAAKTFLDEALKAARQASDKAGMAQTMYPLAMFARAAGDDERAGVLYHEAMILNREIGDKAAVTACLGALAGLAMMQGRSGIAARLFALAHSLLDSDDPRVSGFCDCQSCRCNETEVSVLRKKMGDAEFDAAWAQGGSMSLDEAVDYASRGRGAREELATSGWASLTKAEREVVQLLPEGLSNAEIGERLFMSPRTVGAHLAHIYSKLDIHSRKEVARMTSLRESED
ncbi:MAG: LuxR C-terminal-related transcriptional regulator [Actinomycetota bacterium]